MIAGNQEIRVEVLEVPTELGGEPSALNNRQPLRMLSGTLTFQVEARLVPKSARRSGFFNPVSTSSQNLADSPLRRRPHAEDVFAAVQATPTAA